MAAGDLTTVEKVRTYLGLTTLDADAILTDLVTAASKWITTQIGRSFVSGQVTETLDGDGTTRMLLGTVPVSDVTSVTVDGDVVPERTTVDGEGWVMSDDGVDLVGYTFTEGVQNVVIVYTAGESVPADLAQAAIELTAFKYRRRTSLGMGTASAGGESVTYTDAAVLAGIEDVLSHYRELVVA